MATKYVQRNLTQYTIGGTAMTGSPVVLEPRQVGDTKALTIVATYADGANRGSAKDITSATVLVLDPDYVVIGEATDGSTTTLIDTTLTEANSFWVGVTLLIHKQSGDTYTTRVTGFTSSGYGYGTSTLTFNAIDVAVEDGDTYKLLQYPRMAETSASVTDNTATITLTPSTGLGTPGKRLVILNTTFTDGDVERLVMCMQVLSAEQS